MGIYNLSNINYLKYDLEQLLDRIYHFYNVDFSATGMVVQPKMLLASSVHWASAESMEIFNSRIPFFKSLVKDMYAIIEAIYRDKDAFEWKDIKELEQRYSHFREFRLLNNQLKHFKGNNTEIDLVGANFLGVEEQPTIQEVYCQYKQKSGELDATPFSKFIILFLTIMIKEGVISVFQTKS